MERATVRGRYDRDAETEAIVIILSASPATGGRSRFRQKNVWDTITEFNSEFEAFLDTELPENDLTP
jgi:hypothetical protein